MKKMQYVWNPNTGRFEQYDHGAMMEELNRHEAWLRFRTFTKWALLILWLVASFSALGVAIFYNWKFWFSFFGI